MRKSFLTLICLIGFHSFSQEMIKNTSLSINKKSDVFQIVEENKKQVSLFFSDKNKVHSVRFDENFSVIDSIASESPSKDYDDIVGYSISGNQYYVYWSNSNGKEMLSQCFDYDAKKANSKPVNIPLAKEKIIKQITVNNIFYMITIVKSTGILNFYILKDGNLTKKTVDLTAKRFLDREDKITTLWEIVSSSTNYEMPYSFQTISNESPASLAFSANKRKIYVLGNKLLFTLDNNRRFTQTFTIDLDDFSASTKMFTQPNFPEDQRIIDENGQSTGYSYDSNSFFLQDKIVQTKINSSFMKLSVKDMEGLEKKQFLINSQEITFKNSDIYQENGNVKSKRVLDKSSQLIRKINDLNPSLSIFSANDNLYMVIGGVSLVENNAAMYGALLGGFTGALIGSAISSNYSMNNLNSYKGRKVVYINCLFDNNFNHLEGNVKKTAFDKLREFSETKENLSSPVVFKFNSALFYAGFDKETKTYSFYKFND
ncbi:hypothetical protein [Flavobacterium sp. UBA7682]|uniref:hypothetical protein n=1 Tax=Flavobacterium sp. UBA7682 TaxID=1946560 RepID=UPI0025C34880|nr:hypothetical protein [Flavobacterium sp. UBA7682]